MSAPASGPSAPWSLPCGCTYQPGIDVPISECQRHAADPELLHPVVPYVREVLVEVLVYHNRRDIKGCGCGWAELGRSHPEHVATVYEASVFARASARSDAS